MLNKNYNERTLWNLADDAIAHLTLQMGVSGYSWDTIHIANNNVSFSVFEADEMNTVRKVILLLIVAVSDYDDEKLIEKWVVELPNDSYVTGVSKKDWGDLFEEFPITAKAYCLDLAYNLLARKLSDRNTALFRVLFICTCLELWRMQIPPEIIVWPAWKDVHWWNVILNLTGNFSNNAQKNLSINGFGGFIDFLKIEVDKISTQEIPRNILEHLYSKNNVGTKKECSLVQWYLSKIMQESRSSKLTQLPPSA